MSSKVEHALTMPPGGHVPGHVSHRNDHLRLRENPFTVSNSFIYNGLNWERAKCPSAGGQVTRLWLGQPGKSA